jgi:hypothetical protein
MSKRLLFSRAFVDQASSALLYFKLHQLAVVFSPASSLFYIYLPACMLSDLAVVGFLQAASYYLFQDQGQDISLAWTSIQQEEDEEQWTDKSASSEDAAPRFPTERHHSAPQRPLYYIATCFLLFLCFVSIAATVLAVGMYEAGSKWDPPQFYVYFGNYRDADVCVGRGHLLMGRNAQLRIKRAIRFPR